jgi:spore coat polysaccharide biosynthesis protein SpsF (cytidylyltransferase family)
MDLIIIQARSASTRLWRKAHRLVAGKEMWRRVYNEAANTGIPVVLAVPIDDGTFLHRQQAPVMGGDPTDLINRFRMVIEANNLKDDDRIIRLTADCPLITKEAIWSTIAGAEGKEYFYNCVDGFDCEVFTYRAFKDADLNTTGADREHVTRYLRNKYMPWSLDTPHRLSVDTMEDWVLADRMLKNAKK